jgi:hypothetical protein
LSRALYPSKINFVVVAFIGNDYGVNVSSLTGSDIEPFNTGEVRTNKTGMCK